MQERLQLLRHHLPPKRVISQQDEEEPQTIEELIKDLYGQYISRVIGAKRTIYKPPPRPVCTEWPLITEMSPHLLTTMATVQNITVDTLESLYTKLIPFIYQQEDGITIDFSYKQYKDQMVSWDGTVVTLNTFLDNQVSIALILEHIQPVPVIIRIFNRKDVEVEKPHMEQEEGESEESKNQETRSKIEIIGLKNPAYIDNVMDAFFTILTVHDIHYGSYETTIIM